MQTIPQASTIVLARPLEAAIRNEIEKLRAETASEAQMSEISRLEAIAGRVRDIDALGERILSAVMPVAKTPQLRRTINAKARPVVPLPAKTRPSVERISAKQAVEA
jgi:hypothetical protein